VKYAHLEGKFHFSPIAFETFGPWGSAAREVISEIGRRLIQQTGEKRAMGFLRQRCSLAIQRGNAACVLGTHPYSRGLDEVFYVLNVKH
jgi:hypothetical protein